MSRFHFIVGPPGSDPTTYAFALAEDLGAVCLSLPESTRQLFDAGATPAAQQTRCEDWLWNLATRIAHTGTEVVLDFDFGRHGQRERYRLLAADIGCLCLLHILPTPKPEPNLTVAAADYEPPTPEEIDGAVRVRPGR